MKLNSIQIGKKFEKEGYKHSSLVGNLNRKWIIEACRKPKSFTDLKKILKVSAGTLSHHLGILEESKVIEKLEIKEGDKLKRGKQISLQTNSKKLKELEEIEDRYWASLRILPYNEWIKKEK